MKYKFGSIITDGSGKLGGQVFSRNHYGNFVKNKVSPIQPNTVSQLNLRSIMASVTSAWESLTDSQRFEWSKFSESYPQKDRFGHTFYLSGFNFFRKINMVRLTQSMPLLSSPLAPLPFPVWELVDITAFSLNPSIFCFINPSPPAGYIYQVFSTPVLSPGVNYCKGKFVLIGNIVEGADYPCDIYSLWFAKFNGTLLPGYAIFFKIALVDTNSGFVSSYVVKKVIIANGFSFFSDFSFLSSSSVGSSSSIRSLCCINDNVFLCGLASGSLLYRSTDSGNNFTLLRDFSPDTIVQRIIKIPNGNVYINTYPSGSLYLSIDNGVSFSFLSSVLDSQSLTDLFYCGNGVFLASSGVTDNIYRSSDFGLTWVNLGTLGYNQQKRIFTLCSDGSVIVCVSSIAVILKSFDYFNTYTSHTVYDGSHSLYSVCSLGNSICIGINYSNSLIFRSIDNGISWYPVFLSHVSTRLASILYCGNGLVFLTAQTPGRILFSFDFGVSFSESSTPFSSTSLFTPLLSPGNLFYCSSQPNRLILRSTL